MLGLFSIADLNDCFHDIYDKTWQIHSTDAFVKMADK